MGIRVIPCEQSEYPLFALGLPDPRVGTQSTPSEYSRVPDSTAGAQSTLRGTATVRRRVTLCVRGARPDVGALRPGCGFLEYSKRVLGQLSTRVLGVRAPICIPGHVYIPV